MNAPTVRRGGGPAGGEPVTAPPLLLGVDALRPADAAAVGRRPGGRRFDLPDEAADRVARSVAARDGLVASGQPVYGVTTGFGDRNVGHISAAKVRALQRNLVRYHLVGSGPPAPPEVVRATMLIRANCLARGWSGVRAEVIGLLLDCLAHDILPVVPERGSVGASGDLVPLCYLANLLTGQGEVDHAGRRTSAAEALRACRLRPVELQAKEALGLVNGTSFMSGYGVVVADEAAELAVVVEVCTALAVDVLRGNADHFHPIIHAQKPHPGQVRSAAAVRSLLAGSALCRTHRDVLDANRDLGDRGYQLLDHPIQDRYSVRCAPHVVGVLRDTLDWVDRWLATEINSTNDNPLFHPDAGTVHNGGNFYGGHVGLAMDALKVALASVGDLLDRQLALIVDEKFNNGLPAGLAGPSGTGESGLHHGFKGAQIACSALVAEALKLGMPATAFSRSTEAHNQDKVSMGTIAARDARTVAGLVRDAAALHLAALCQAADLRGADRLGAGTRAAYDLVRAHVGFVDADRRLDGELAALGAALRAGAMSAAVAGHLTGEEKP
ncbi:HAL/PAL/TAL family ammonia-lyase [Planosporangium sp. 12N6]|uniref:HAL/PAL/TAL family ammonia-lyase n=1 Tax=Planosporangium spinosum TaxID=3402278 RepID=UPI003CF66352